jgi:uncharacterized protein YndB with AHSA1/START domain
MTELKLEADIGCPAEKVFDLITDFGGQNRWLAPSSSFRGTAVLSPGPVALGTTYRESEPFGVRNGTVTEFDRPAKVTFHQPMTIKLRAGTIDVTVRYTLTSTAGQTHVTRVVTLGIPWSLKLFQPALVSAFRKESRRTLLALKAYADHQSSS